MKNNAMATTVLQSTPSVKKRRPWVADLIMDRWLYLMLVPGIVFFILFKYVPMFGIAMAFQDYRPHLGFLNSPWVGSKHFERLFADPQFMNLLKNTLILAVYDIIFYFPIPILLSLLLNEVRLQLFKRTIQTLVYIPHFISWVVVVAISYLFFTTEGGVVNDLIASLGMEKIPFLLSEEWFRPLFMLQAIWKDAGWGTIIFLAALAGVDPQLYEASRIDGANRWHQLWLITLPAIRSTIVILFILRLGNFLDVGFEHIFLMLNPMNREVAEVFETYIYRVGLTQAQFSYSTAVGLFKSLIGLVLVLSANWAVRRTGEEGIW